MSEPDYVVLRAAPGLPDWFLPPHCDVCSLPDLHHGSGDGIGSCDCPRCECGVAEWSDLCTCPPDDEQPWPDSSGQ